MVGGRSPLAISHLLLSKVNVLFIITLMNKCMLHITTYIVPLKLVTSPVIIRPFVLHYLAICKTEEQFRFHIYYECKYVSFERIHYRFGSGYTTQV